MLKHENVKLGYQEKRPYIFAEVTLDSGEKTRIMSSVAGYLDMYDLASSPLVNSRARGTYEMAVICAGIIKQFPKAEIGDTRRARISYKYAAELGNYLSGIRISGVPVSTLTKELLVTDITVRRYARLCGVQARTPFLFTQDEEVKIRKAITEAMKPVVKMSMSPAVPPPAAPVPRAQMELSARKFGQDEGKISVAEVEEMRKTHLAQTRRENIAKGRIALAHKRAKKRAQKTEEAAHKEDKEDKASATVLPAEIKLPDPDVAYGVLKARSAEIKRGDIETADDGGKQVAVIPTDKLAAMLQTLDTIAEAVKNIQPAPVTSLAEAALATGQLRDVDNAVLRTRDLLRELAEVSSVAVQAVKNNAVTQGDLTTTVDGLRSRVSSFATVLTEAAPVLEHATRRMAMIETQVKELNQRVGNVEGLVKEIHAKVLPPVAGTPQNW